MPAHDQPGGRAQPHAVFRREGDYWTVVYDEKIVRLKDAKGVRYLHHLLRHPGRVFTATELTELTGGGDRRTRTVTSDGTGNVERARKALTNRIRQTVARIGALHTSLGLHLSNSVRTGTRCTYTPERPMRWEG